MGFRKFARVESLATFTLNDEGLVKVAQRAPSKPSYFLDGARTLDVRKLLDRVASTYAISNDPGDYFFEIIRANTTTAPNENNDAFPQRELLRYDVRLGMPVYGTYAGKPHHLNHKTDNPKAARGVILDAHYNDDAQATGECRTCKSKTAARTARDESGLHCKKCGTLVKDEFVEILLAIDAKKDPLFAEGVRKGQLRTGSMGCNCLSTTCNVCGHVAYSKPEFCEHIRTGNKGTYWKRQGSRFVKTSAAEIKRELAQRHMTFYPEDFTSLKLDGFEVRKAFEDCNFVVFDEYSRVDLPADPKAEQIEILRTASQQHSELPTPDSLRAETEALIRSAEAKQREAMSRSAQMLDIEGVELQLEENDEPIVIKPPGVPNAPGSEMAPGGPMTPGEMPPMGIDQFTEDQLQAPGPGVPPMGEEMDLGEMGVLPTPPGASAPRRKGHRMHKFSQYDSWKVQVSDAGNAQVVTSKDEKVLLIAGRATQDPDVRRAFGLQIFQSLRTAGLVATAKKYRGVFSPKFAQVVEGGANDMQGYDDHQMFSNPLDGGETDMAGIDREKTAPESTRTDADQGRDMADARETAPETATADGAMDHERKDLNINNVTNEDGSDMRDKRAPVNLKQDSVLDDPTFDHAKTSGKKCSACGLSYKGEHKCAEDKKAQAAADAKFATRLQKVTAAKLKKAQAEVERIRAEAKQEVELARRAAVESFARALRLAAKRQEVGLEEAPFKLAAEAVLAETRPIGKDAMTGEPIVYHGLDEELTRYLVAQLFQLGHEDQLEALITRAGELMERGDQYLVDAEADTRRMTASLPVISAPVQGGLDETTLQAEAMRRAAMSGNLAITPAPSHPANGHDKRTALRSALGGTKVAAARGRLGLN